MNRKLRLACGQLVLALTFLLSHTARAQLQLVVDANQTPALDQSQPEQFTPLGAITLFVATSGGEGKELWKTDGTPAGTVLVKDINPGTQSSNPLILAVVGSVAYLTADDGVHGAELWKTDGTTAGTVLVKDIFPGPGGSSPYAGAAHQGMLYFNAQDYDRNYELWKSDGTDAGTVQVVDLMSNSVIIGSDPGNFISTGPTLFFTANTELNGERLFKTDGTAAGTVLVPNVGSGTVGSGPIFNPVVMNSTLYFSTSYASWQLWRSDGTAAGTHIVKAMADGGYTTPIQMVVVGSTLYFDGTGDIAYNRELWKSDGTAAGTVLVTEINPGTGGSNPTAFKAVGSEIYFFANDGSTGIELWKSDGTAAGTMLVQDLQPSGAYNHGGASLNDPSAAPPMLEVIGTNVYFYGTNQPSMADGTSTGGALWKSDGTPAGTVLVKQIVPAPGNAVIRELKAVGSLLYFSALQPGGGTEPYVSDGTSDGTFLLKDISSATTGSDLANLTPCGGKLYFTANDGANGMQLWMAHDTGTHLTRVTNMNPNLPYSPIAGVGALNGTAFFGSSSNADGSDYQLWRSDGTAAGTFLVSTAPPLSPLTNIPGGYQFRTVGNLLFFDGNTPDFGTELWRTDGTAAGTFMLKDISPGPDSTDIGETTALGNVLYFVAGYELWRSDGTAAGTHMVKPSGSNGFGAGASGLTPLGSNVFYSAYGQSGDELYKSNGAAAGTTLVKDVSPVYTTPINSTTLLFAAYDPEITEDTELWKTNGTAAGTVRVKDICPGTQSSNPTGLVQTGPNTYQFGVINGVAFFSANDGTHGNELWKSDGTAAGTVMVKDIAPGPGSSNPTCMVVVGNKVYFIVAPSYTDPGYYIPPQSLNGTQLWSSDGTEAGTVMVDNQLSNMSQLTVSGTTLYVVGNRSDVGTELFMLPNVRPAPFTITQSPAPASQTIAVDVTVTLTVATTGGTPTYQWRKDGVIIPGATKTTYAITKATEAQQGSYDVLVRSGDFELLSDAAQVNVTDPNKIAITQQPGPRLVGTGGSATFQVAVVGQTPAYQWYKGVMPIDGATAATFTIPAVQMTDAALYKVKISNSLGSVFSSAVQLAVVTSTDQYVAGKAGATLTMTAPATDTGLTYLWLQSGNNILPADFGGRISGMTTAKLSITKFSTLDESTFSCLISLGGQAVISGNLLPMVAAIPVITATATPPNWIISGPVILPATALFTQSNLGGAPWNAPTRFTITGLPKGMTYDPKTGLISGRPQAGGGTSVTLSIKVGNVAGTTATAITVAVPVQVFPALASGAFRGLADRSSTTLNDNLGDYVQVDITTLGSLTGKLYRGTTAYSFIGRSLDTVPGSTTATATVSIPRPGSTTLTLNVTLDGGAGAMSGTLTDSVDSALFTCKRSPWTATGVPANPATAYAKAYTAVLQLVSGQTGDVNYPQGESYAVASVTTAGAVSGAVRLADSTKVTFSTLLGAAGEVPLHIGAYANTGSLHGWSQITSGTGHWDGSDTFYKAVQPPASTTRSYKAGVPLSTLTLVGGVWTKPTPAALLLGVSDNGAAIGSNNASMVFTQGGIASSGLASAGSYQVALRIKAPASTFVLPAAAANTGKLTVSFASLTTGEITGSFTTTDANPELPGKTVTRAAPWFGVIVQRLSQGRGHFNLPELQQHPGLPVTASPLLSGQVLLESGP